MSGASIPDLYSGMLSSQPPSAEGCQKDNARCAQAALLVVTKTEDSLGLSALPSTEQGSHRAGTGSQSTAPRKWRMGARH